MPRDAAISFGGIMWNVVVRHAGYFGMGFIRTPPPHPGFAPCCPTPDAKPIQAWTYAGHDDGDRGIHSNRESRYKAKGKGKGKGKAKSSSQAVHGDLGELVGI
jgi:hypothetical protein